MIASCFLRDVQHRDTSGAVVRIIKCLVSGFNVHCCKSTTCALLIKISNGLMGWELQSLYCNTVRSGCEAREGLTNMTITYLSLANHHASKLSFFPLAKPPSASFNLVLQPFMTSSVGYPTHSGLEKPSLPTKNVIKRHLRRVNLLPNK